MLKNNEDEVLNLEENVIVLEAQIVHEYHASSLIFHARKKHMLEC